MFSFSPNIAINVRQQPEALDFYQKVLGMELIDTNNIEACGGAEMKGGPITFWISGCKADEESDVSKVFFEFDVQNLDEAKQIMREHGCQLGRETQGTNFKGVMVTDPYGLRFHLYCKLSN